MSGRQVMAAFKKATAECPADEVDVAFAGRDKLRYGDSSQRGDETTRLTPIPELTCGLPIGLEQPLCGLDVRGAALEPASHEKINPRSKSQLSRWSDGLLTSLRAFILPSCRFGGGSGPAPRVTLLLFGSAPLRAENSDPVSSRTCTTNRPAE